MNNRFKFRVWDTNLKEYNTEHTYCLFEDGVLGEYDSCTPVQEWYIVEQCTGFYDKNGNLIYEGDIVKCGNTTGVIKFGFYRKTDEHFPDSIYGFYIEWEKQCRFRQDFGYWITDERIEIIGNIHENKGE